MAEVLGALVAHGLGIKAGLENQERPSGKTEIRDLKKEEELAMRRQDGRRDGG